MQTTGTITLEDLEFFAYHGLFQEERKIGNKYSIDLTIEVDFSEAATEDKFSATVDYGALYKIIANIMQHPTKLLENIAYKIIKSIFNDFPQVLSIEISVAKHNPPVGGVCKWAKVKLKSVAGS
ncbi:MAG: dihydroneopterin aldolase [Bacteroidetes bacterium]|nr:MAG: dihydroneopterin aldolase [Bacteroidota bacterium]TAG88434.1 MAG: dihydroneopterin aldolase [Bacteroidota bacterium]